jgi:hypothetical protein
MRDDELESPGWKDLAARLQARFGQLGIILARRDLHLLGDLELLDARCQELPKWIEALTAAPDAQDHLDKMASIVGRLMAEVQVLADEASRIQGPLKRLLTAVTVLEERGAID